MPTRTTFLLGWTIVFGSACVLFLAVALLAWWQHHRLQQHGLQQHGLQQHGLAGDGMERDQPEPAARPERVRSRRDRRSERAEWQAHAAAVASRADETAGRAATIRERAAVADRMRAEAWESLSAAQDAYEAAESAYRRSAEQRAGRPDPAGTREVANAALAAYRRGDLSQDELLRVWRWGSGWDPELDRQERAVRQARAARREANLRYLAAANAARAAADQVDLAEAEARVLAEEQEIADRHADPGPRA